MKRPLREVHFSPLGPVPPHDYSEGLSRNNPARKPEPIPASRLMWFDTALGCYRSAHTRPIEPAPVIGSRYSRLK